MSIWATVDVGGTSIKTGAVDGDSITIGPSVPSSADGDRATILETLRAAADAARDLAGVDDLVLSVPGPFDHAAGISGMTHKFASIEGVELRPCLAPVGSAGRVHFVDDAEAMALGTVHHVGALDERVLVIALGTGFGSALVVSGRPVRAVGDVVVGELWQRPGADGRLLDGLLSATGLATALGVHADELAATLGSIRAGRRSAEPLTNWARSAGDELARCVADLGAERVLVAGGAAPVIDLIGEDWAVAAGVDVVRVEGAGLALLGAARSAQAAMG